MCRKDSRPAGSGGCGRAATVSRSRRRGRRDSALLRLIGGSRRSARFPRLMPSIMAFFKRKEKAPAEVQRLDWKLLERGAVALYHKSSVLSQDLGWFRQQGYTIHELDAGPWKEPAEFHTDAQRLLSFPSYYTKNL